MRPLPSVVFMVGLLAAPLAAQEKKPATGKPQKRIQDASAKRTTRLLDAAEAKAAIKAFKQGGWARKPLVDKMLAIEELSSGAHPMIARQLNTLMKRDKSKIVRVVAARNLVTQPVKDARRFLVAGLLDKKLNGDQELVVVLIKGLEQVGYRPKKDYKMLERYFRKGPPAVSKAVAQLFGKHKEKQALKLWLNNLDEPAPVWVDDPSNPPAAYWEARWKAWRVWVDDVRAALKAITGQRFENSVQARKWVKKNGKKHGLKT